MKFRVLAGKHAEKDKEGTLRVYSRGEVVDSKSDLSKLNSRGAEKFEKIDEPSVKANPGTPAAQLHGRPPVADVPRDELTKRLHADLDKMSNDQLKKYAETEEVDLKGAKTREEMLKVLKAV